MKERVVVGLSGGVDSSVAAFLLKEAGYDVVAVFMINWHDKTGIIKGDCPWDQDVNFAEMVAKRIKIPLHVIDLSDKYREKVVDYMFREYKAGRTPNPDVLCNREIKFDEFFCVLDKYEADFVATGHYCRINKTSLNDQIIYSLLSGIDKSKDQSYFLCQLNQYQLSKSLFPIGHLTKAEVRKIAGDARLASADRKDSQGICFVGKVDLPEFLQQKLKPKEGEIIEIPKDLPLFKQVFHSKNMEDNYEPWHYKPEDGIIAGKHRGAHYFTIGQRKGLNIGGKSEPLFVLATDTVKNLIYAGQGQDHPGLFRKGLFIPASDIHWVRPDLKMDEEETRNYLVRVRYRQTLQEARLHMKKNGLYVLFKNLQRGITPGQFAAWYDNEELIGSGVIN